MLQQNEHASVAEKILLRFLRNENGDFWNMHLIVWLVANL